MSPIDQFRPRLATDLQFYAKHCLKIKTKRGELEPFIFNKAQEYIHSRLEDQKARTGKVRAIIIKGRQMGASTYVSAREFHNVTHRVGRNCFILTHQDDATQNLFNMVSMFEKHLPEPMKLSKGAANAKELYFDRIESGYKVGTAGNKEVGRSSTIHLLHGSEVAFWPNAENIVAGLMQAIPDMAGTEIILESTANGIGDYFHTRYQQALSPDDEYEVIFVPWYWMPEYSMKAPADFQIADDEYDLVELYGLTNDQIAWRRKKINEFVGDGIAKFKQEYPCTPEEAFVTSSQDSLIKIETVLKAAKTKVPSQEREPIILGVDPAAAGGDRFVIMARQGRRMWLVYTHTGENTMLAVSKVVAAYNELKPAKINVEVDGMGIVFYDRLAELISQDVLTKVIMGGREQVLDPDRYYYKKDECVGRLSEWLLDSPCEIEDNTELIQDLIAFREGRSSNGALRLESNDKLKSRGMRSPDMGIAAALTHAFPVIVNSYSGPLYVPTTIV